MRRRLVTPTFVVAHLLALHLAVAFFAGRGEDGAPFAAELPLQAAPAVREAQASEVQAPQVQAPVEQIPADAPERLVEGTAFELPELRPGRLDLSRIYEDEGRLLASLGNGWTAELTCDADLQRAATKALNRAKVPFGAVVMIDPRSGDVLAMADRFDEKRPNAPAFDDEGPAHMALRAIAPAASVFKLVTAAALIEQGISTRRQFSYFPSKRKVHNEHLGAPSRSAPRSDMGTALAKSNNGFFARLADTYLDRDLLLERAELFGFNRVLPFPLVSDASTAQVPRNRLERARMAAGFWRSRLTPLHGALIAAAIAGDGQLPSPRLVERLHTPTDRIIEAPRRGMLGRAMSKNTARKLRKMLVKTVRSGTARRAFSKKGSGSLRGISIGGKTGSLALRDPYTAYTWFIGYAPADNPEIAIAVMVGNGELWWQRAGDVARYALDRYFKLKAARVASDRSGRDAAPTP